MAHVIFRQDGGGEDYEDPDVAGPARKYKEGLPEKFSETELENLQVRHWNTH